MALFVAGVHRNNSSVTSPCTNGTYRISDAWLVALGADNLTDEYPDESDGNINFFGHLPYDVLSPIGMNGRYWYARTSFDF